MLTDTVLLQQFMADRSAQAFHQIVRRYAGMVFGVALRVTADRATAEDVTQDCFFTLTQKADQVRDSLPGWLHRVALNRAREVNRSEAARRRREQAVAAAPAAANGPEADADLTWARIAPQVDAALAKLPDDLRTALVAHFLSGRSQTQVAQDLGVNQGTISRRIERGLDQVRNHLRRAGVAAPAVGVLATLLTSRAVEAAPPTLAAALGKITLAGASSASGTAAVGAGAAATGLAASKAGLIAAVLVAGLTLGIVTLFMVHATGSSPVTLTSTSTQPVGHTFRFASGTWWDDSFSQAIVAVADYHGLTADYDTVHRLSTNLLAPAVNQTESCGAWWHWYGRDAAIDLVGSALGLRFDRLQLPEPPRWSADFTPQRWTALCDEHRARCAPAIRAALNAGKLVITGDGWVSAKPDGFIPWCQWGVVRAVADDHAIIGSTRDDPAAQLKAVSVCYAVTKVEPVLSPGRADRLALGLAADRIRAQGPFDPQASGDLRHGVAAMDCWIDRMAHVPGFCADCRKQGRGFVCAQSSAQRMIRSSRQAAEQLRVLAGSLGPQAAPFLREAALKYEHIADLLAPAVQDDAPGSYKQTVGNLKDQEQPADTLRQVKADLLAAAAALEQAAAAIVRRDGDKVWIDDVPPALGVGNGYIRGLEIILKQQGLSLSYERLMGLSGLAFITQADVEHRWEGKVDVGWWPLDAFGLQLRRAWLGQAIGVELIEVGRLSSTAQAYFQDVAPNPAGYYRRQVEPEVKRAIDAGRPALAVGDEVFVVSGYDAATDQPPLLGRTSCDTKAAEPYRMRGWPWSALVFGERVPAATAMDAQAADVAALRYALRLMRDQAGPFEPQWRDRRFTGQKAFAVWAGLLRNLDEPVEDRHHANMKLRLTDQRSAAASFLREMAGRYQGDAAEALKQAAADYDAVLEQLAQLNPKGLAGSADARRRFADQVEDLAGLEQRAAEHLEEAVTRMPAALTAPR